MFHRYSVNRLEVHKRRSRERGRSYTSATSHRRQVVAPSHRHPRSGPWRVRRAGCGPAATHQRSTTRCCGV